MNCVSGHMSSDFRVYKLKPQWDTTLDPFGEPKLESG